MIYGRNEELRLLENDYKKRGSSILAIYGRRRIGKSVLIQAYAKDKPRYLFEAIEEKIFKFKLLTS